MLIFSLFNRTLPLAMLCGLVLCLAAKSPISAQANQAAPKVAPETARLVTQPSQIHGADWLAFSDDNRLIVSTHSTTATAIVWDAATGDEIRRFTGNTELSGYTQNKLLVAAFSPDSRSVAVMNVREKILRIWAIDTGKLIKKINVSYAGQKAQTAITSLLDPEQIIFFAYTQGMVLVGYTDRIQTWNPVTGKVIKDYQPPEPLPDPTEIMFTPNMKFGWKWNRTGNFINQNLSVFDPENEREIGVLPIGKYENTATVSLDGKLAATADLYSGAINIWDVASKTIVMRLEGYSNRYTNSIFTADGLVTISQQVADPSPERGNEADSKGLTHIRNLTTGNENTFETNVPLSQIRSTQNEPNDQLAQSLNMLGRLGFKFDAWASGYRMPATVSKDGVFSATDRAGKVTVRRIEDGQTMFEVSDQGSLIQLSSHGKHVLLDDYVPGGKDTAKSIIKIFDIATKSLKIQLERYDSGQTNYHFKPAVISSDERFVVYRAASASIAIWDLEKGAKVSAFNHCAEAKAVGGGCDISAVAISPDDKLMAVATYKDEEYRRGKVFLVDASTGRRLQTLAIPAFNVNSLAFSPDGLMLVTGGIDSTLRVWDIKQNRQANVLEGHNYQIMGVDYSPDGKFILSESWDQTTRIWNAATGKEIAQLINLTNDDWVTVAPDGRFDSSKIEDVKGMHWVLESDPLRALPIEIFMRDYYEPSLLPRLLRCNADNTCDKEFKPLPNIADLNRVQPKVKITDVSLPDENRRVTVSIEVSGSSISPPECKMKKCATAPYDLRLFRDGQIVGAYPSDGQAEIVQQTTNPTADATTEKTMWRKISLIPTDKNSGCATGTSECSTRKFEIQLPRGKDVSDVVLTAYAFNEDRVKSPTAVWNKESWSEAVRNKLAKSEPVKPRAYIISIGVNAADLANWNLTFAVSDARQTQRILQQALSSRFEVVPILLASDYQDAGGNAPKDATKENIRAVFDLLAGRPIAEEQKSKIPGWQQIRKSSPDDAVFISVSSHGYVNERGIFFVLPANLRKSKEGQALPDLDSMISSDELALWLRDVDAGQMVMVIDSCYAEAAVAGTGFKPGPMGDRGLGQLAYDKQMRILTATHQKDTAIEERTNLKHGLLTAALMLGFDERLADFKPAPDGKITLDEWLEFAVSYVPKLYAKIQKGEKISVDDKGAGYVGQASRKYFQTPVLFDLRRDKTKDIEILP
jgi:WD40 repeat protein/uncharacterized caspase-like protein